MQHALQFITAFSIVEFFFTFFIMHAAQWLSSQVHLDVVIDWVMFALFLVLGIITWLARNHPPKTKYSEHASIKYGIILGIVNPMQVPFWMICGTYLITHEWIEIGTGALIIFSLGSAAGSFLCLFLYAKFARYIQSKFALSNRIINTAIAILFFGLAGYHLVKRVYLAVKPRVVVINKIKSVDEQFLIGQWDNIKSTYVTKTKRGMITSIDSQSVLCNVCPVIIFSDDHTASIKSDTALQKIFRWNIVNKKLSIKNITKDRIIDDGSYGMTTFVDSISKKLELRDTLKGLLYTLR